MNIEIIISLTFLLTFIYIFAVLILILQRYLRINTKNKVLVFTQKEAQEKHQEINDIINANCISKEKLNKDYCDHFCLLKEDNKHSDYDLTKIVKIFSIYNTLAIGISEGLYDEVYIRISFENEMIRFYKDYYRVIISSNNIETDFMALELLLRKWDSEGKLDVYSRKRRRYLL